MSSVKLLATFPPTRIARGGHPSPFASINQSRLQTPTKTFGLAWTENEPQLLQIPSSSDGAAMRVLAAGAASLHGSSLAAPRLAVLTTCPLIHLSLYRKKAHGDSFLRFCLPWVAPGKFVNKGNKGTRKKIRKHQISSAAGAVASQHPLAMANSQTPTALAAVPRHDHGTEIFCCVQ